jgi:cancer susceptibility candidate protein 1
MSKAKKAQEALEAAMKKASEDAQKLYKYHEKERRIAELQDRADRDAEIFDFTIEQERLALERTQFAAIQTEVEELRTLVFREHKKHVSWTNVVDASWLPSVFSECEINAFLSAWREEQLENEFPVAETTVNMSIGQSAFATSIKDQMHLIRGDIRATKEQRQRRIDNDLELCKQAKLLTEELLKLRDASLMEGDKKMVSYVNTMLKAVYAQIMTTLDVIACNTLQYYDLVLDHPEDEMLVKQIPKEVPMIKYGLWIKIKEATRSFTTLRFTDIGVSLDPRDSTVHKLPKALGLSKENVAMRVMQLSFDPYEVWLDNTVGQEFYALDCLLVVEPMIFADKPKRGGDWLYRSETNETHKLHKQEYPPKATEGKSEDPSLRVSFEVPENVVIRQKSLLIGKWNQIQHKWDPCGHCNFASDASSRKTSFVTSDLTTMAVIQEKGFDVPFEQWQLFPLSDDQVLFVLEGRRRGEASDREIKILVSDDKCKLLFPEEKELTYLRENWLPPATLLRYLSRAGYNLLLTDHDAEFTPGIRPKTKEMEAKGYQDLAHFCTRHAIASTRHNKLGENRDMALFRMSRDCRAEGSEEPLLRDVDDDSAWLPIRYERERCVISAFREADSEPNLSSADGKATHLNLVMLMGTEYSQDTVKSIVTEGNKLLQHAVLQLLHLTRPFTWG